MHTRTSARRRAHVLGLAVMSALGARHNNEGDKGGGGGGGDPAPEPDKGRKQDKPAPETEKLTLTPAELDAKIQSALKAAQDKADAKAKKEKEDADAKAAEEQGKWKELAEGEKAKREAAESEANALRLRDRLRNHLDEHKPELAKAVPVIAKLIDATAADEDADKAIKAAVAEYEKSLPEKPKGGSGGAPAPQPRTGNRQGQASQQRTNGNGGTLPNVPERSLAARTF